MQQKPKVNLSKILNEAQRPLRAIYISSYIPRKCGIGTFTKDLTTAINNLNPEALAEIIAVTDEGAEYDYPWETKFRIHQHNPDQYIQAAHYINQSSADVVNLQHEFGLYGGVDGDYILPMIDFIEKPIVSCFHSILPEPDDHKKYIMKRIIENSAAVIAMSEGSKQLLIDVYGADEEKAVLIYHGVPDYPLTDSQPYKKKLGIDADFMLMLSGLFGPGKGIEYVVDAMPEIIKTKPNVKLYLIGETHPSIVKEQKESYRDSIMNQAKKLGVEEKVVFINKFLELNDLMKYFMACDIYLTPHLDPQQPTSGTLSKALGVGRVAISTPYVYAKEMLANETGILVPFRDSKSIAKEVLKVINDPKLYDMYCKNAYKIGKLMQWPRVADRYLKLFQAVVDKNGVEKSV